MVILEAFVLLCGTFAGLPADAGFTIDEEGYFRNGTKLYIPVGVNYWFVWILVDWPLTPDCFCSLAR
jgi:hypothetical protein